MLILLMNYITRMAVVALILYKTRTERCHFGEMYLLTLSDCKLMHKLQNFQCYMLLSLHATVLNLSSTETNEPLFSTEWHPSSLAKSMC